MNIDNALETVGEFGRYQIRLLVLLWIIRIPMLLPVLLSYFTVYNPSWRCSANSTLCTSNLTYSIGGNGYKKRCKMERTDWEFTEPKSFSIVTQFDLACENEYLVYLAAAIFFFAWAFGSVPMGWLSDRFGRKTVSFPCLFISMGATTLSAFSANVTMYIICRFITGFFSPGSFVPLYIVGTEAVSPKYRPCVSTILSFSFITNLVLVGIKAYFIREWKALTLVCTLPYIFVFLFYRWIPESLRWLRVQGRKKECMNILKNIAEANHKNGRLIRSDLFEHETQDTSPQKTSILTVFWPLKATIKTTLLLIVWFTAGLVFYAVTIAADNLGGDIYRDYIISSLAGYPGAILSLILCKRYGRKVGVVPTLLFTAFVLAAVAMIPEVDAMKGARIFLGMSGKISITACFESLYLWSIELNPTVTRSFAMGLLQFVTRIGASSSPWVAKGLREYNVAAPFILMSSLSLFAGFLSSWLPETRNLPTAEVAQIADKENENENENGRDDSIEMKDRRKSS